MKDPEVSRRKREAGMSQVSPGVTKLTAKQEKAAILVAQGELSVEAIAQAVGVTRESMWRWSKLPAYIDRIKALNAEMDGETWRTGKARKRNRVLHLSKMADLLAERIRASPKIDPGLVREWRLLYEHIARELGQFADRFHIDVNGSHEQVEVHEIHVRLDADEPTVIEGEWSQSGLSVEQAVDVLQEAGMSTETNTMTGREVIDMAAQLQVQAREGVDLSLAEARSIGRNSGVAPDTMPDEQVMQMALNTLAYLRRGKEDNQLSPDQYKELMERQRRHAAELLANAELVARADDQAKW